MQINAHQVFSRFFLRFKSSENILQKRMTNAIHFIWALKKTEHQYNPNSLNR